MKYLIAENLKVLHKGIACMAGNVTEDFVYDTEGDSLVAAMMKDVAKKNGFKTKGKKATEIKKSFDEQLTKLDLPEKLKMSKADQKEKDIQSTVDIVEAEVAEGTDENNILIKIVQSGIDFISAVKYFKLAKEKLGLSVSKEDRNKKAAVILEDEEFEAKDYKEVQAMVKLIVKDVPSTTEAQALMSIKKFCKDNDEMKMPTKPKAPKADFKVIVINWMMNNMDAADEDLEDFIEEAGKGEKTVAAWTKTFKLLKEYSEENSSEESEKAA